MPRNDRLFGVVPTLEMKTDHGRRRFIGVGRVVWYVVRGVYEMVRSGHSFRTRTYTCASGHPREELELLLGIDVHLDRFLDARGVETESGFVAVRFEHQL